jgi:hypothetical protein
MKYKIAFFTENRFTGPVPDSYLNFRTDIAWMYYMNADHYNIADFATWDNNMYDIAIVIPPKVAPYVADAAIDRINSKTSIQAKYIAIMQEGPNNSWTDFKLEDQLHYLNMLNKADFLLCHNNCDKAYYTGLTAIPTAVLPPVLGEHVIPDRLEQKYGAIIGGNMTSWYNGMVSYMIATEYKPPSDVYAPTMGRRQSDEHRIAGLKHIPYSRWDEWMASLSQFKIGVHMMPTVAAGTFALNCAYWGIPCIGNRKIDSQLVCHPDLSVDIDDIEQAKYLADRLSDDEFYNHCSNTARSNYKKYYSPEVFIDTINQVFTSICE